ncbi:MAG: response regulator transcription factor [Anaerolineales bacterium]
MTIRILLADDHTVLREATAELIDNQPDMVVVAQAGTGEETIALAKEHHPDVVVMDIAMPRIDGVEATRKIIAECPDIKVVVLSAHQDVDHVLTLLEEGATSYLPKTVGLNELLEALRKTNRGESVLPPSVASIVVRHLSGQLDRKEEPLTDREIDVLTLAAKGLTNKDIAQKLHLSPRTIEAHLTHIYKKLEVGSRTEAAMLAQKKGWISLD